jgi:hypothetical protein
MNLFTLAEIELKREGKEPTEALIIDYACKIRKWFDKHGKKAEAILQGQKVYQYGNVIKTYERAI